MFSFSVVIFITITACMIDLPLLAIGACVEWNGPVITINIEQKGNAITHDGKKLPIISCQSSEFEGQHYIFVGGVPDSILVSSNSITPYQRWFAIIYACEGSAHMTPYFPRNPNDMKLFLQYDRELLSRKVLGKRLDENWTFVDNGSSIIISNEFVSIYY